MGSMGQWTADGLISISSSVTTTVGDWDGIRAGDPDDIDVNGRLEIGAAAPIIVGGNMPDGLWADGGGGIERRRQDYSERGNGSTFRLQSAAS